MSAIPTQFDRNHRRSIQMALNEKTANVKGRVALKIDGDFGAKSVSLLGTYQALVNLPVSKVYDAATQALLEPFIDFKYLKESDYVAAAKTLSAEVAAIKAVVEVEAGGDGFLPDGRVDILFERHIFYRELKKKIALSELQKLVDRLPNICNPATGGYFGNEREYERLAQAIQVNLEAAYLATSWGFAQIMGFNYKQAGFQNVTDMVYAMNTSEANQLQGFVWFIKNDSRLLKALQAKDWATFARYYNGPAYAENKYDTKMAGAYKVFA